MGTESLPQIAHSFAPQAVGVLIGSVWQGALLAGVAAVLLRALQGISAAARTWFWLGVLALTLCLPLLPLFRVHAAPVSAGTLHLPETWSDLLLAVWVTLASFRTVRLAADVWRLCGVARRSTPVSVPLAVQALLGGPRPALVCVSGEVNRPSVAGFLRPRVLLPVGLLETISPAELEYVVLHEMEHLRRGDDWMNLVQQLSLVVLPLNPALLWVNRQLCREREVACDDGVLATTNARRAYAACLVKLAEDSMLRKGMALALSALGSRAGRSELVGRVGHILAGPKPVAGPLRRRLVAGSAATGLLLLGGVLAQSPELVHFDAPAPQMAEIVPFASRSIPSTRGAGFTNVVAHNADLGARPLLTSIVAERTADGRTQHAPFAGAQCRKRAGTTLRIRAEQQMVPRWRTEQVSARNDAAPAQARTAVERTTTVPAHLVVTEFEVSQPVYAAVPWRGGWLIVQL